MLLFTVLNDSVVVLLCVRTHTRLAISLKIEPEAAAASIPETVIIGPVTQHTDVITTAAVHGTRITDCYTHNTRSTHKPHKLL